jgi:hypothetical protein
VQEGAISGGESSPPGLELVRTVVTGYVMSRSIYLAAELGVADLLADGPRSVEELAAAAKVQPQPLYRVLRLLAASGLFAKSGERGFMLNDLAECLRSGVPGSMRNAVLLFGEEPFRACGDLPHMVKTGDLAFEHVYNQTYWEYLADHPAVAEAYHDGIHRLMGLMHKSLVAAYDFAGARTVVDVGGGLGLLLSAILAANPTVQGVLFETPVALPGAGEFIRAQELSDRCELVAGDFFQTVPEGGDIYLLKSILHSWDDEESIAILRNCRRAMHPDGTILLIERILPEGSGPFFPIVDDILMMVTCGGAERTETEYQALYEAAGFSLTRVISTSSGFSMIEGKPHRHAPA